MLFQFYGAAPGAEAVKAMSKMEQIPKGADWWCDTYHIRVRLQAVIHESVGDASSRALYQIQLNRTAQQGPPSSVGPRLLFSILMSSRNAQREWKLSLSLSWPCNDRSYYIPCMGACCRQLNARRSMIRSSFRIGRIGRPRPCRTLALLC